MYLFWTYCSEVQRAAYDYSAGMAVAGQWQLFWANGSLLGIPPSARSLLSPAPAKVESAVTDPRRLFPATSVVRELAIQHSTVHQCPSQRAAIHFSPSSTLCCLHCVPLHPRN